MSLKHKLTSVFLAMLMLLYALPLTSLASDEPVAEPDQELSDIVLGSDNEIAEAVVVGEVISERTERTKTFRLSDGSYIAADYGRPVHFLEDDVWVDFDNTLVDSPVVLSDSDDFAGYITSAGDVRIKLANNSNSSNLVKIQGDEYKVSMHLVDADKSKAVELYAPLPENEAPSMELTKFSSGAIYKDILPSVDLEYIISGNSVKENIIVKEKRDNYTFTFELKINGLTPALLENGDIALNDSTGETKMLIPAAYMFDANGVFSDNAGILAYNVYAYCANDSVNCCDTSGCVIEFSINTTAEERSQYDRAIAYLQKSKTARQLIQKLQNSSTVFTIIFEDQDNDRYYYLTNTIVWDFNSGLVMSDKSSIQSAALGLAHEMGHAAQDLDGLYKKNYTNPKIEKLNLKEYETPIAKELGEPTRKNYNSHFGVYTMNNSTHFITTKKTWNPGWWPWQWFRTKLTITNHNL